MRVVVITGAGAGIGAATARRLAKPGRALMLHARGSEAADRARVEAVAVECRASGAEARWHTGDLAVAGEATTAIDMARRAFGPIDAIVHAAGFADRSGFSALSRTAFDRSIAAMPGAFFELVAAALGDLTRTSGSRVVAVSSFVAHRFAAGATFPASAAAKAALEALGRSLAVEMARSGGTANAVVPGYTRKDAGRSGSLDAAAWAKVVSANPQGRLAEPDEIAAAIAFLLSAEAGHITGAMLPVDGGLTLG